MGVLMGILVMEHKSLFVLHTLHVLMNVFQVTKSLVIFVTLASALNICPKSFSH